MYEILITDDEQIVLDSLSFIMKKNFEGSVKVYTALSGTEAIEIASKENIDIIFMDINMPGLTGLETVSCITKLKPEIVVVMLSAFDKFQYAQEAMNLGAFKYITKPVNRNVVIQTVRSAMDFIDNRRGSVNADIELHKKLDLVNPMVESDFIYACIFNNDKNIEVSAIFIAIGQEVKNEIFANVVDINSNGYFKTIDDVHTKTQGIYIAGDARDKNLRQLTTAVSDGAIAAMTAIKEN